MSDLPFLIVTLRHGWQFVKSIPDITSGKVSFLFLRSIDPMHCMQGWASALLAHNPEAQVRILVCVDVG